MLETNLSELLISHQGTVIEYESDSVASDSDDEKKIRAAESRSYSSEIIKKRKL